MKVDFRLNNVPVVSRRSTNRRTTIQDSNIGTRSLKSGCLVSFTANPLKNTSQVASIAPEYQGIMNSVYKVGGLGNVAGEASVAFSEHGNMDFRSFIPYYAPDNATGEVKIKKPLFGEDGKRVMWKVPKMAGNTQIMENGVPATQDMPAFTFISVPLDYKLQDDEAFVIHEPMHTDKPWLTGYKVIEDTGISGSVESITPDLTGVESTPYKVFSVKDTGIGNSKNPPVYIIHTPELAKFPKAYGGSGAYVGGSFDDASYGIFSKAAVDAIPKFNKEEFGDFNPANLWLHDRQAFTSITEIAEKSSSGDDYWKGFRAHSSYHNPGRDYQGHYKNPVDFMRIIGSKKDLEELQKNPDEYQFVKEMIKKIEDVRSQGEKFAPEEILEPGEMNRLNEIFKPLYGSFLDEKGEYNMCEIPIEGVRKNPFNYTAGTVSTTYGREMKNHNMVDIAPGLTKDLASIPTVDIVNGSSAKSMGLDVVGNFGRNNGFTDEIKQGFTPLTKEVIQSPDLLFEAKQSNKKWLLDTIAAFAKKGEDGLKSLFFSKNDAKSSVIGSLSEYKDKDVLFVSWGRPDSQKGFPTTLEGILDYFQSESVPAETKEHAKFLIGAGPWSETAEDWKTIQKQIQDIQALDGGRYKGNVCYLNGFFTNRIVACADYSNITSRYEPCGITPLESFAGGTPVISNKTGGSPDFVTPFVKGKQITNETGFLTKNAYLVKPEVIGANPKLIGQELDDARRIALGKENAECIEQAVNLLQEHPEEYKKMMTNAVNAKIDWHENITFNGGLSAIERYKEQAWAIGADNKALAGQERNTNPLVNLKGFITKKLAPKQAVKEGITEAIPQETVQKEVIQQAQEVVETAKGQTVSFTSRIKDFGNSFSSMLKNNKPLAGIITAIVAGVVVYKTLSSKKDKLTDNNGNDSKTATNSVSKNNTTNPILNNTDKKPAAVQEVKTEAKAQSSTIRDLSMDKFLKKK